MKDVNAQEAYEMMQKDPNVIYLDVRSVPELEQGHPQKSKEHSDHGFGSRHGNGSESEFSKNR